MLRLSISTPLPLSTPPLVVHDHDRVADVDELFGLGCVRLPCSQPADEERAHFLRAAMHLGARDIRRVVPFDVIVEEGETGLEVAAVERADHCADRFDVPL